jgi:hypothetical protein
MLLAGDFQLEVDRDARVEVCGATEGQQRVSMAQVLPGSPADRGTGGPTTPTRWTVDGPIDGIQPSPPQSASVLSGTECVDGGACDQNSLQGRLHGNEAVGTIQMTVPDPVPSVGVKIGSLDLNITHRELDDGDIAERHVWISNGLPNHFAIPCALNDESNDLRAANDWRTDPVTCDLSGVEYAYFRTGNLVVNYQVVLKQRRSGDHSGLRLWHGHRIGRREAQQYGNGADTETKKLHGIHRASWIAK